MILSGAETAVAFVGDVGEVAALALVVTPSLVVERSSLPRDLILSRSMFDVERLLIYGFVNHFECERVGMDWKKSRG